MKYSQIFKLIVDGDISSIREEISNGFKVNEVDQYGFSLLHRACANNKIDIVRLFLDSGSLVNITATDDWNPLHLAAVSGSIESVALLAKASIDMDAKDKNGCTALHLSVTSRNPALSKELIKYGCSKDILNNFGHTPLEYAKDKGREQFYAILG